MYYVWLYYMYCSGVSAEVRQHHVDKPHAELEWYYKPVVVIIWRVVQVYQNNLFYISYNYYCPAFFPLCLHTDSRRAGRPMCAVVSRGHRSVTSRTGGPAGDLTGDSPLRICCLLIGARQHMQMTEQRASRRHASEKLADYHRVIKSETFCVSSVNLNFCRTTRAAASVRRRSCLKWKCKKAGVISAAGQHEAKELGAFGPMFI